MPLPPSYPADSKPVGFSWKIRDEILLSAWSCMTRWVKNGANQKQDGFRVYQRGAFTLTELWDSPNPEFEPSVYKAWARLECDTYCIYNKCRDFRAQGDYIQVERGDEKVFWSDYMSLRLPELVNGI